MRPVSKGLKFFTAILACILIIFGAGAGILLYFQYANRPEPVVKKAFIILPDLMGSSLLDDQYDNAVVWSADPSWLLSQEEATPDFINGYMQSFFQFGDDCAPLKELTPADASVTREDGYELDKYAFNGITKKISDYLFSQYAEDGYEVITWQYDWRQSNLVSAEKLEQFINDNGYTNLIILSHGMGGNVIAKYLSDIANRMKVDLYLPFAAPFLGTLGTIDWLFNKDASMDGYVDTQYSALMESFGMYAQANKMPSLAGLIPYPAMSQLSIYEPDEAPVLFNGAKVSYNEMHDYFCSQNFAKTDSETLKDSYENLLKQQRMDYIKIDGKFRHITEFVNTVYVVGTGISTRYLADINTATGNISNFASNELGDGFVWAYSATAGLALNAENVITVDIDEIDYNGHSGIIETDEVLNLVKPIIETNIIHKQLKE